MKLKKPENPAMYQSLLKYSAYFAIFGAVLMKGAFFTGWALVLNLFLLFIIITKRAIRLDLNALILIGMLAAAIVSSLFHPAAVDELVKYTLFPLAYIAFSNCEVMLERVFYRSIVFLAAGGLLAITGMPLIPQMVVEKSARLQSFLQYANTTAALLGAGVMLSVHYFITTKKWIHILSFAAMFSALILTKSRIGFWIFAVFLTLYMMKYLRRRGKILFFSGAALVITAFLALGFRTIRVSLFEPTLVERFITYSDALKTLGFTGIGMGEWQFTQTLTQSAPYFVRYIHNVYLQIALDCGVIGVLCFIAVIAIAFIRGLKEKSCYFFIMLMLAAGSAVEVNFSFGIVIVFFMFLLAQTGSRHIVTINRRLSLVPLMLLTAVLSVFLISESLVFTGKIGKPENSMTAYRAAMSINPWNYSLYMNMARTEPDNARLYLEQGHLKNPKDRAFVAELSAYCAQTGDIVGALDYARMNYEMFKYNRGTQNTYMSALEQAFNGGIISKDDYDRRLSEFREAVERHDAEINPLYRHIDPEMRY